MNLNPPSIRSRADHQGVHGQGGRVNQAHYHYTYRRVARVETLNDDNKVDGEWYEVDDVIFDPTGTADGKSGLRAAKHPDARHDVPERHAGHPARLPFVLTTDNIRAIRREICGAAEGG